MGGEALVAVYAIVGRMLMFALFPVFGVTQGFLPIAGFNYGAGKMERVRESINTAILYASALATLVFIGLMVFPEAITALFLSAKNADAETMALNAYVLAPYACSHALGICGHPYYCASTHWGGLFSGSW